jgi:hypothetical protein
MKSTDPQTMWEPRFRWRKPPLWKRQVRGVLRLQRLVVPTRRKLSKVRKQNECSVYPGRVGTILEEITANRTKRLYQIRRTSGTLSRLKTLLPQYDPLRYSTNPKKLYSSTTLEEPIFQRERDSAEYSPMNVHESIRRVPARDLDNNR